MQEPTPTIYRIYMNSIKISFFVMFCNVLNFERREAIRIKL